MKNKVIYTCISGDYDHLKDYLILDDEWDYVCFSNSVTQNVYNQSWDIRRLAYTDMDDVRNARWHKTNPHKILSNYDYSVWIDANIDIVDGSFYEVVNQHIHAGNTFSVMKHPDRNCVYKEAEVIIASSIDKAELVNNQIQIMKQDNYPENNGLIVSSILYRKHNDISVVKVMEDWWGWIEKFSKRDQLSINYVIWKNKFKPTKLPFVYKNPGQSGPLYWRHHDYAWKKIAESREGYISELKDSNDRYAEEIKHVNNEVRSLREQIKHTVKLHEDLQGSFSWRLTRPLRWIKRKLKTEKK